MNQEYTTDDLSKVAEALNIVEERRVLALADNRIGIWQWNVSNNTLIWDQNMLDIYNLSEESFHGKYEDWRGVVHPEDIGTAEISLNSSLISSDDTKFYQRFRVKYEDGWRWMIGVGTAYFVNDVPSKVIGINLLEPVDPYTNIH
jgi:PAS domain-containing protein